MNTTTKIPPSLSLPSPLTQRSINPLYPPQQQLPNPTEGCRELTFSPLLVSESEQGVPLPHTALKSPLLIPLGMQAQHMPPHPLQAGRQTRQDAVSKAMLITSLWERSQGRGAGQHRTGEGGDEASKRDRN